MTEQFSVHPWGLAMETVSKDELRRCYEQIRTDIKGVHDRLDNLNGRTRTSEQAIAVLQDRSNREAKSGAAWGGAVGAIVAGLLEAAHLYFGKGTP